MYDTFSKIYEYEAINNYQNTDIIIDYDEYSSSRLINKRNLQEDYGDYFSNILAFFNINLLTETNEQKYYSMMFSSLDYEFERLIDQDVDILSNEVIITETFAQEYNLNIGDSFNFYILDTSFNYFVGQIYPDTGLFKGLSFFADKETILEEVYGISTLNNFGNTIYLDVNDDYEVNYILNLLEASEDYSGYHVFPAVNWEYIESRTMDNISMFLSLGLVVLLAIIMVLDSLFPIVNKNMRNNLGVINTLGGSSKFVFDVSILQWLIYIFISLILGLLLSVFIINYGIYVYGIRGFIFVRILPILFALIVVLIFVGIESLISFKRENKASIASKSKNKRFVNVKIRIPLILISTLILFLELYFVFFNKAIHSLIVVILSLYLTFNISSIMLILLSKAFNLFKKKSIFSIFQSKHLINNRHIHQSLRVLFISLMSIVLVFSVRIYLFNEIDEFYKVMNFDLAVTNINDYNDELLQEINTYQIESSDKGIIYNDVTVHFNEQEYQPIKYFLSLDMNNIGNYIGIDVIKYNENLANESTPIVILPKNFEIVYDLNVGDMVTLDLNYKLKNIDMIIAGYFDTDFDNIIYSNIYEVDAYTGSAMINSIFINSNDKDIIYNDLIQDYSERMYYVLNPDIYFNYLVQSVEKVINYFSVFTAFLILCFIVVIFNNTLLVFYDVKSDLVKVKILGASKKDIIKNILLEYILILFIICGVGLVEILILSENLKGVVLLINYYKDINASTKAILIGFLSSSLVLFLSYLYYYIQIYKINLIDEMKIY